MGFVLMLFSVSVAPLTYKCIRIKGHQKWYRLVP